MNYFDVGIFNTSFATHSYVMSNASRHVSLARGWSSIPRWLQVKDILTDVEWMYIIWAWRKVMHTCLERHTLYSIVDLVWEHYPQQMGEELNQPIQCCSGVPIAMHLITIDIRTLELTCTSNRLKDNPKSIWIFVDLVVHQGWPSHIWNPQNRFVIYDYHMG